MKLKSILFSVALVSVLFNYGFTMADEGMLQEENINVGNKICPISKEPTESMGGYEAVYNGKTYNLCCQMCEGEFNKDPERYVKMIENMMAREDAKGNNANEVNKSE